MKNILLILGAALMCFNANSQTYTAAGGTTTYNTCSGTFYDSGGSGGNYGNNENSITTFCATGGQCLQVNISALSLRSSDILTVYDGPTTSDVQIAGYTNTTTAPGVLTSSTGCLTFWFTSNSSTVRPGWTISLSCIACPTPADYTHPIAGINNEYVGSCLVADGGPFSYTDNGNVSNNYLTSINDIYRVFCPDQAGECMSVTFNSFVTEASYDYLLVKNGPTQNSTDFVTAPASATAYGGITGLNGDLSGSVPFTYTSTDASGCLTFRFYSDGTVSAAGWEATLQSSPCAGGPNGTDNNDCVNLTPLCSGETVPGDATGPGIVAEGCTGSACPAGGENHSNWYMIQAQTTGTIEITFTPSDLNDDYDFAVYGPNVTCGTLGSPLRCSDSGVTGVTGLDNVAVDNTEDVTGDGFLQKLSATAGDTYIIVVDEWSPNVSASGYSMTFGGTASLDCALLPVELTEFDVEFVPNDNVVDIIWRTASEMNNDFWEIEKSSDGVNWKTIDIVDGAGTTNNETRYFVIDGEPFAGVNYYRLTQWDLNGNGKSSEIRTVNVLDDAYDFISLFPNPTTGKTEVIFNSFTKETALLNVIDSDGKVIINTPVQTKSGANRIDLDMSEHKKGVYLITIITRDKAYRTKLVLE